MRLQVSRYAGHVWEKAKSNNAGLPSHVLLSARVAPFQLFQVWFMPDCEIAIISEDSISAGDSECSSHCCCYCLIHSVPEGNPLSLDVWTRFYQNLAWWNFILLINLSPDFCDAWKDHCPVAVQRAEEVIAAIGEAHKAGTMVMLTFFLRSLWMVQSTFSNLLLKHLPWSLILNLAQKLTSGPNFELIRNDR